MPNANIDYVTSHQGTAHITTQNVIDLLAGLNGDVSGIKRFPLLYNGLANEITDALTIQVKTGAALAGGSFFILEDAFDWLLDAGAVGYSRIDILYLVMYEDPITNVQSCDFDYQAGNLYPNGTTGTEPSAPTGTNITATYPFLRMDMTDGSIVSVTEYAEDYLDNEALISQTNTAVASVSGTVAQVQTNKNNIATNTTEIANMKVTFQDGVDKIYNAITAQGVVPAASTPDGCVAGINLIAIDKYNTGKNDGIVQAQSVTWTETAKIIAGGRDSGSTYDIYNTRIELTNVVSVSFSSEDGGIYIYVVNASLTDDTKSYYLTSGTINISDLPSGSKHMIFYSSRSGGAKVNLTLTRQAKILR